MAATPGRQPLPDLPHQLRKPHPHPARASEFRECAFVPDLRGTKAHSLATSLAATGRRHRGYHAEWRGAWLADAADEDRAVGAAAGCEDHQRGCRQGRVGPRGERLARPCGELACGTASLGRSSSRRRIAELLAAPAASGPVDINRTSVLVLRQRVPDDEQVCEKERLQVPAVVRRCSGWPRARWRALWSKVRLSRSGPAVSNS